MSERIKHGPILLIYKRIRLRTHALDGIVLPIREPLDNPEIKQHQNILLLFRMVHMQKIHNLQDKYE